MGEFTQFNLEPLSEITNQLIGGFVQDKDMLVAGPNAIKMSGTDRTIIINDGEHDRILIGRQEGGF